MGLKTSLTELRRCLFDFSECFYFNFCCEQNIVHFENLVLLFRAWLLFWHVLAPKKKLVTDQLARHMISVLWNKDVRQNSNSCKKVSTLVFLVLRWIPFTSFTRFFTAGQWVWSFLGSVGSRSGQCLTS